MLFLGRVWTFFAPLSLVAAATTVAFTVRAIAPDWFALWSAFALAAALVFTPVYLLWRQDMATFRAVCSGEGTPSISRKAVSDGFLLTSERSDSYAIQFLQHEGFQWVEFANIRHRGDFVRYARDDKGAISSTRIDAPTARYEVRDVFEQRPPDLNIYRTLVIDRQSGVEMARATSVNFNSGRTKWLLGAWGADYCPNPHRDPAGFEAWYHIVRNTLR